MEDIQPIDKEILLRGLPPVWEDNSLRQKIAEHNKQTRRCVVALDDDPTGTQTVHDIWVLTRWEVSDIRAALADGEPALYILTNSRSMPLHAAMAINREIAANLAEAARAEGRSITVVSRSDSALRGHFPGEIDALSQALADIQGRPFDGVCLLPFFPEGGRFTVNNIHWVQEGQRLIPAAQTPYARDAVFGYNHSSLPAWVEEKTGKRVTAMQVKSISIDSLRLGGPHEVARQLRAIKDFSVFVVNAVDYRDLEVFVAGLLEVEPDDKRFLFRTAASFVKVAAGLPDQSLLTSRDLSSHRATGSGLIVFGSHVPKSSAQLVAVRALKGVEAVELPVNQVLSEVHRDGTIRQTTQAINAALAAGRDALVYTSRELVRGSDDAENLAIGKSVSAALMQVVQGVEYEPRFVIGKGGITSSDLATEGMQVRSARVLGQVLPGVPVWKIGTTSRWPGLIYVVFPGNVGDDQAVARVVQILRS
jgi:uncharacterized protein YgbK (DUF1537 family)